VDKWKVWLKYLAFLQAPSPDVYNGEITNSENPGQAYALTVKKLIDDMRAKGNKVGAIF